ncbi:hypothetical protein V2I01_14675 [Micromonospora sp. BRA006-A]|nr:hypothetical protein [Micromonospora sp. BRA006-A]
MTTWPRAVRRVAAHSPVLLALTVAVATWASATGGSAPVRRCHRW